MAARSRWEGPRTEKSCARALGVLRSATRFEYEPACRMHEVFVHLVRDDTRAQSLRLIADPHPVVRLHAAECLLTLHAEAAAHLLPLLSDDRAVVVQRWDGCESTTVGESVGRMLRIAYQKAPEVRAVYDQARAIGLVR